MTFIRFPKRNLLIESQVARSEYQLLDIEDGFLSLLTEEGDTRDDLKLPDYPEGFDQVRCWWNSID